MIFSSTEFIYFFLPVVVIGYYALCLLGRNRFGRWWLILSSLFFYGFWKPIYLPLIIGSILFNYSISSHILLLRQQPPEERNCCPTPLRRLLPVFLRGILQRGTLNHFLFIGILFNIGLLGFFKYFDFFIANFSLIFSVENPLQLHLLLPLGISFFTFQQIAYLVDCNKGLVAKLEIDNYFLFVVFFPQLIAGPIVHHKEMMPQFAERFNPLQGMQYISKGVFLFSIGFFKKSLLRKISASWWTRGFLMLTPCCSLMPGLPV